MVRDEEEMNGHAVASNNNSMLRLSFPQEPGGSTFSATSFSDQVSSIESQIARESSDTLFVPLGHRTADATRSPRKRRLFGQRLSTSITTSPGSSASRNSPGGGRSSATSGKKLPDTFSSLANQAMASTVPRQITMYNYRNVKKRLKAIQRPPTEQELLNRARYARRKRFATPPSEKEGEEEKKSTKKNKIRIEKYIRVPKNPRTNTAPIKPVAGGFAAPFNPFGLDMPNYRLPAYSSLGHGTSASSDATRLPEQGLGHSAPGGSPAVVTAAASVSSRPQLGPSSAPRPDAK